MNPNATFTEKRTYDRLLNKANNFSRNYLSTLFTRKSTVETENISTYISAYDSLRETVKMFNNHKTILQLKSEEINCFEELMGVFA